MAFRTRRMGAVLWKDLLDLRKNRGLIASMAVMPLVMITVPIGVVFAYVRNPADPALREVAIYYHANVGPGAGAAKFLIEKTLADWFGLFLILPLFVPILVSSASVAGEKERRTLEPLLASPATALEIVVGKSLAALIPALLLTFGAFAVFCVGVDWVAWPLLHQPVLPDRLWTFGLLIVAPLFAFFGNVVAITISAWVGESRLAQQLSGLVTLPLLGLVGAQIAGFLRSGTRSYGAVTAVVAVLDVLLLGVSMRLFDRERLLTRWG